MIDLHIDAQGVATLTLDQPQRAMNVIDWAFAHALHQHIEQIATDPRITGVILTSGKSSFLAGADLAIMADFVASGVTPRDAAQMIGRIGAVLRRLETLGKPVVGASTGTALGGGLELLLACHYRVAADVPGAVYGLPEVSLGLLPGAGGTQRLPRLIGMAKALPLMLSGRHLSTDQAQALGLLDQVVPADQVLSSARQALLDSRVPTSAPWDQKGFRLPGGDSNSPAANELFLLLNGENFGRTHGLQPAPKAIACCVYEGSRLPIDRALRIEQMYFAQLVQSREAQAMIQTLFFARQALEKAPGRPASVPRRKLTHITVAGDASWQLGLKQAAEAAGLTVVTDAKAGAKAGAKADTKVDTDLLVGESPGQVAMRWFHSGFADLPAIVEIAPHTDTTDVQLARAFDLARQLRAVPVLLSASSPLAPPARYTGRCIEAALAAAQQLIADGVSAVVVNNAVIAQGWPSLRAMATAIGQNWTADESPLATSSAATDQSLRAVAGHIAAAQRHVAEAAISAATLTPEAANLAAVLGAGYPRHLGGPLIAPR